MKRIHGEGAKNRTVQRPGTSKNVKTVTYRKTTYSLYDKVSVYGKTGWICGYESIPPKVEYSLTEIGKKFHPVIAAMQEWGQAYIEYMNADK